MDRFVVRGCVEDRTPDPRKIRARSQGLRLSSREVDGRLCSSTKLWFSNLMLESYSEVGRFDETFEGWSRRAGDWETPALRPVITSVDFDAKGVRLASVGSGGSLAVHDFGSINHAAGGVRGSSSTDVSCVVHVATGEKLESVRWSCCEENELACTGSGRTKVYIFDVDRMSYKQKEVLGLKSVGNPWRQRTGFLDLCYFKGGSSRLLACGNDGCIHLWDRRCGKSACWSASVSQSGGSVECIHLSVDDQVVYAGSKMGRIHSWDLRGGHSAAFMASFEMYHPPLFALAVADLLKEISSLKAQTEIMCSGIHSVAINPCCQEQLAFHLNNGWTGVISLSSLALTHVHCPPSDWQSSELAVQRRRYHCRRPTWLATSSIYAVGSPTECAIHLLDLTAGRRSHCSLLSEDGDSSLEDTKSGAEGGSGNGLARVDVSECVVALAAHPFTDQLVAGTQDGSLLLVAPQHKHNPVVGSEAATIASSG